MSEYFFLDSKGKEQDAPLWEEWLEDDTFDTWQVSEGVQKFNPYHDEKGRFTTGPGGGAGTKTKEHVDNATLKYLKSYGYDLTPEALEEYPEEKLAEALKSLLSGDHNAHYSQGVLDRVMEDYGAKGATKPKLSLARAELNINSVAPVDKVFGSMDNFDTYKNHILKALPDGKYSVKVDARFLGKRDVRVTFTKKEDISLSRVFTRKPDGSLVVNHEGFEIAEREQGKGIGKAVVAASVDAYLQLGVSKVTIDHVNLDVGGYAWARLGFLPTPKAWKHLTKHGLGQRLSKMFIDDEQISQEAFDKLSDLLDGPPSNIRLIAGARHKGKNIGYQLLAGTHWQGELDLKDPEAVRMARGLA